MLAKKQLFASLSVGWVQLNKLIQFKCFKGISELYFNITVILLCITKVNYVNLPQVVNIIMYKYII